MENRKCKKCKRALPEDYKYELCESCRNKRIDRIKTGSKVALGVLGTAAGVALVAVLGKKKK